MPVTPSLRPIEGGLNVTARSEQRRKGVDTDGSGPYGPGMEARMAAVEKRLDRVEVRLDSIDERLRSVESTLANVSGKIDILASNMSQMLGKLPSWWQMPVVVAGTAALVIAIIKLFASN